MVFTTDTTETGTTTLKLKVDQLDPLVIEYINPQDLHTMLFDDPLKGNCSSNVGAKSLMCKESLQLPHNFG